MFPSLLRVSQLAPIECDPFDLTLFCTNWSVFRGSPTSHLRPLTSQQKLPRTPECKTHCVSVGGICCCCLDKNAGHSFVNCQFEKRSRESEKGRRNQSLLRRHPWTDLFLDARNENNFFCKSTSTNSANCLNDV